MSAKFEMLVKSLTDTMKKPKKETSPYDTTAVVKRIEGDTAYVHISGGVEETPVSKTVDCKAGDTVQVRVGGGRAWITGNATSPPTDDTTAVKASGTATKFITDMVDGIFVHPESDKKNGVKITDGVYIIKDNKVVARYGEVSVIGDESGKHLFIDNDSADIKDGKKLLARFDGTGLVIYDGDEEIARFYNTQRGDGTIKLHNTVYDDSDTYLNSLGLVINHFGDDSIGSQYASDMNTNGVFKAKYEFDGIYNNNFEQPVGTYRQAADTGVPQISSGVWTNVDGGLPTLTAGTWLVTFGGAFDANDNGMRQFKLNSSLNPTAVGASREDIKIRATIGEQTTIVSSRIIRVATTLNLYLHAYQNSGTDLFVYPTLKAIKLV